MTRRHSLCWSDQLGSARSAKLSSLPSGVGPFLFNGMPTTIYPIANTGAMLDIGQERSKENAALAVEPVVPQILTAPTQLKGTIELSRKVSGSIQPPVGLNRWSVLDNDLSWKSHYQKIAVPGSHFILLYDVPNHPFRNFIAPSPLCPTGPHHSSRRQQPVFMLLFAPA